MDDLLQEFIAETGEHLDQVDRELVRFEQEPDNAEILRNIFRLVHTVKGTCGFIGLPRLEALTHAAESVIGQFRDGAPVSAMAVSAILETIDRIKEIIAELAEKGTEPAGSDELLIAELRRLAEHARTALLDAQPAGTDPVAAYLARHVPEPEEDGLDLVFRRAAAPPPQEAPRAEPADDTGRDGRGSGVSTLRVSVDTLEHLMTMVSELVLTRNQLLEIARQQEDAAIKAPLQRLSLITAELQEGVMKTRMQPIGNAWSKLPRLVRDLSRELGKSIELDMQGTETELDRQILDLIKDPLTHMVRNCADHAIELPEERRAAGKPAHGTIRLVACHEGGSVTIAVSDDGRGLDLGRIRRKAVQSGLASEAEVERMSDQLVARLIFHPGFSTAETVTSLSGRGVGMDVVKSNVDAVGGLIDVATLSGQGTTITIKIPLTLAIISALIVSCGGQRYAIPQIVVRELVRVRSGADHRIERIDGAPVLRLREHLLPIVALSGLMGAEDARLDEGFIVVTQIGDRQFGIQVDSVFHTEEIVVKPMSTKLRHIPLFSGNTILGDGAVVLIVDPNGVARLVGASSTEQSSPREIAERGQEREERSTLLVFRAGASGLMAVPLSLVTRLEEVDASRFESGGGRTLLNYRGRLMPVIPVGASRIRSEGMQPLVIVSEGTLTIGLAVDAIVDIVEETVDLRMQPSADEAIVGSAIVRGQATDIVDVAHYLPKDDRRWLRGTPREAPSRARVLLVEPSDFMREMLVPVLRAAGLDVTASAAPASVDAEAARSCRSILVDLDRDPETALAFARRMRAAGTRLLGLTTFVTPDLSLAAGEAGFERIVAKFDRRALLAELGETWSLAEAA